MIDIKNIDLHKEGDEISSWFSFHKKNKVISNDKIESGRFSLSVSKYDLEKYDSDCHKGLYIDNKLCAYMLMDINESYFYKEYIQEDNDEIIYFQYLLFNPKEDWIKILRDLITYFQSKKEYAIQFSSLMDHHDWFNNIIMKLNGTKIPHYLNNEEIISYFIRLTKIKNEDDYKMNVSLKIYNDNYEEKKMLSSDYDSNFNDKNLLKEHSTKCYIVTLTDDVEHSTSDYRGICTYANIKFEKKKYKIKRRYLMFKDPLIIKNQNCKNELDNDILPTDDIFFDININGKKYYEEGLDDFSYKRLNKICYLSKRSYFLKVIYGIKINKEFCIAPNTRCGQIRDINSNVIKQSYIHEVNVIFSTWINNNFEDTLKQKRKEENIIYEILNKETMIPTKDNYDDLNLNFLFEKQISIDTNNRGIVYLIQPANLIETNRYKVGMSCDIKNYKRLSSYGKGTRYLAIFENCYPKKLETNIKEEFKNKYRLISGTECFECDKETQIVETFLKLCLSTLSHT